MCKSTTGTLTITFSKGKGALCSAVCGALFYWVRYACIHGLWNTTEQSYFQKSCRKPTRQTHSAMSCYISILVFLSLGQVRMLGIPKLHWQQPQNSTLNSENRYYRLSQKYNSLFNMGQATGGNRKKVCGLIADSSCMQGSKVDLMEDQFMSFFPRRNLETGSYINMFRSTVCTQWAGKTLCNVF